MTAAQAPGTTAARGSQEGRQPREAGSGGEGDRPAFQLRKCHLPRTELSGRNQTSARHASSAKTDGHVPLPGARTAIARACAYAVLYWTPHKSAQLCAFTRWPRFRLSRLQRSVGARMLSGLVIRALGASTPGLLSPPCGPRHPVQPTRPPAAAFSGPCGSSWKSLPFLKLTPLTSSTETPEHKSQLYLSVFFKSFLFLSFIYTRINISFKSLHVTLIFR